MELLQRNPTLRIVKRVPRLQKQRNRDRRLETKVAGNLIYRERARGFEKTRVFINYHSVAEKPMEINNATVHRGLF